MWEGVGALYQSPTSDADPRAMKLRLANSLADLLIREADANLLNLFKTHLNNCHLGRLPLPYLKSA